MELEKKMKLDLKEKYFEDTYGLDYVVDKLWSLYNILCLQKERENADIHIPLLEGSHFAIVGSRGSGKTMIGDIIARLLHDFGIRESEESIHLNAREITEAFYANGEEGIESLFNKRNGNTIVIENFQNVVLDLDYDKVKGRRICVCLDKVLQKKKDVLSIIFTMDQDAYSFIQSIDTDFVDNFYEVIEIEPYSIQSLLKIAEKIAYEKGLLLQEEAEKTLFYKLDQNYRSESFLNAISIKRYIDEAVKKMAERYYSVEQKDEMALAELKTEDFETEFQEETLEELLAELDGMTGLENVKKVVHDMVSRVKNNKLARESNAESVTEVGSMHLLFTGNPGTGKTTVARMIGKIYQQLGVLARGHHTIECTRSGIVGRYQGHTAELVQKRFLEAEGGVLFIDEAYSICRDDGDTFGQEAVDELTPQIENHRNDTMVILAGYSDPMDQFLDKNEGLRSRFNVRVEFEDYTQEEMVSIFYGMVKKSGKKLEEGTEELVKQLINEKSKVPDFGNARGVRNVYESVLAEQSNRIQKIISKEKDLTNITKEVFDCIRREDIQAILSRKMPGEKTLDELLQDLNAMPGLQEAKQVVMNQINRLSYQKLMKERGLHYSDKQGTMHMLFKGNAGTGKTTMARIIAQIYQKLGILKKNTLYEVKRADLVGRYQGESAQKTLKVIDKAEGGILFIDEAYDLVNSEHDSFGMEALNSLVADLENRRDNMIVIMAGYGDDLDKLMEINQGLESRFPNHVYFEDYSTDELVDIFFSMLKTWNKEGVRIEEGVEEDVRRLIEKRKAEKSNFGNARGVRNVIEAVQRNMEARVVQEIKSGKILSDEELTMIKKPDLTIV